MSLVEVMTGDLRCLLQCGKVRLWCGVPVMLAFPRSGVEIMKRIVIVLLAGIAAPGFAQSASEHADHADNSAPRTAMILDGYGGGGFKVDTANPRAQAFFDNGMQLAHAFAHKAAIEAMKEAVRLDPHCAMCAWGEAWASGPTINYEVEGKELAAAAKLAGKADRLARAHGTARERALTEALRVRYRRGGGWGHPGDLAFAKAMNTLAEHYPHDDEIATLAADAWLQATDHEKDETTKSNSARAVALLEPVLTRNPDYTPAIHFYIHATELSDQGPKAERYADRLGALAPKASHLVHMPSHTFYWVGRYADAARVNRQAVDIGIAQAKAMDQPPPDGVFGLPYHAHNVTFGLGGALMAGDADNALYLGRQLVAVAESKRMDSPFSQALGGSGYVALALFADAKEVMALPAPTRPYLKGLWHYARGESFARSGNAAAVRAEAAAISAPVADKAKEGWSWQAAESLHIAQAVLLGRAAMIEGKPAEAAAAFRRGAERQEQEAYGKAADPPLWWFPVRRSLAEAKLAAGDAAGARAEAEATLKIRPRDPGAMALLARLDGAVVSR